MSRKYNKKSKDKGLKTKVFFSYQLSAVSYQQSAVSVQSSEFRVQSSKSFLNEFLCKGISIV